VRCWPGAILAAADDPADRDAAAGRLLDYYLHTALTACGKLRPSLMIAIGPLPAPALPDCAPRICTAEQAAA
jgi:hypothetical protein